MRNTKHKLITLASALLTSACLAPALAGDGLHDETVADAKQSIGGMNPKTQHDGACIPSKVTKIAVLDSKQWKKKLLNMNGSKASKYLFIYGMAKKKLTYRLVGPLESAATEQDFKYLIGSPICMDDPDADAF